MLNDIQSTHVLTQEELAKDCTMVSFGMVGDFCVTLTLNNIIDVIEKGG